MFFQLIPPSRLRKVVPKTQHTGGQSDKEVCRALTSRADDQKCSLIRFQQAGSKFSLARIRRSEFDALSSGRFTSFAVSASLQLQGNSLACFQISTGSL